MRAFAAERFPVWRCATCGSIHSGLGAEELDLGRYYRSYPYHRQRYDLMTMLFYDVYERRLRRGGVTTKDSILDYGCGSGHLLRFLRWKGFGDVAGYDAHSEGFGDQAVLARRYDCVIAQDIIEHVEDPRLLMQTFAGLVKPGGRVVIGTPNADAIDLQRPEDFRHPLHQPYHRHILSQRALLDLAREQGWELLCYFPRPYTNTGWPLLNQAFMQYYARSFDDTMDLAFDGLRFSARLLSPWAWVLALLGYFFVKPTDVMAVFRTGAPPALPASSR